MNWTKEDDDRIRHGCEGRFRNADCCRDKEKSIGRSCARPRSRMPAPYTVGPEADYAANEAARQRRLVCSKRVPRKTVK